MEIGMGRAGGRGARQCEAKLVPIHSVGPFFLSMPSITVVAETLQSSSSSDLAVGGERVECVISPIPSSLSTLNPFLPWLRAFKNLSLPLHSLPSYSMAAYVGSLMHNLFLNLRLFEGGKDKAKEIHCT